MSMKTFAYLALFLIAGPPAVQAGEMVAQLQARAGDAIARGDLRAGVRALERLQFQDQLPHALRVKLVEAYLRLDRIQDAHAQVELLDLQSERRTGRHTSNEELVMLRARIAARKGDWPAVRDLYRALTARSPANAEAHLFLGQALQALGESTSAEEAFSRYAELTQAH